MIETERLILRPAEELDRVLLCRLWSDPWVMADIMRPMTAKESNAAASAMIGLGNAAGPGHGFWMIDARADGRTIGFCALKSGDPDTPIAGELEIGWILAPLYWGQGFAREATQAAIAWAWASSEARRIVAVTSACNRRSRALMARLGMTEIGTFDHPHHTVGDRLRASVIYAIERPA